jgi:hypothetical protein
MRQYTFRTFLIASGALALLSVVVFWSFNELSELFGGPQPQFKHAIAAIGILLVIKWIVTRFGGGHERSSYKHRRLRSSRHNVHDH